MKKQVGRRVLSLILTMVISSLTVNTIQVWAADYTIKEATFYAKRLDVVCFKMDPLETVYNTYNTKFMLKAADSTSGYWVNGEKVATEAEYTQWGLHPSGTTIKGAEYAPGDYFEMKGTFTETLTNQTYDIDLHLYCASGSGTGASSSADWRFVSEADVPVFTSITGLSNAGANETGAYATLLLADGTGGTIENSCTVTAIKDGQNVTLELTLVAEDEVRVQTTENIVNITSASTYVIPATTEFTFGDTKVQVTEEYRFYASQAGLSHALPIRISYYKAEEMTEEWKLIANCSPSLNATGTIGSMSGTIQKPGQEATSITIDKVKRGDTDAELAFYISKEQLGETSTFAEGTKLVIQAGNISETLFTTNDLTLLWNGEEWTDRNLLTDLAGDGNGDGQVDLKDVIRYVGSISGANAFAEGYVSDLNKDGVTNGFDTALTRRIVLGAEMKEITYDCSMEVTSPSAGEIVYPYVQNVYDFFTTEGADIWEYYVEGTQPGRDGSLKDITISWKEVSSEYVNKYMVEFATQADFSDACRVYTNGKTTSVGINNLYKASDYYVRVTAYAGNVMLGQTEAVAFATTDIGPRVMTVDGVYNVRDLGGYMTESGKRTVQGMIYRGGEMDGTHHIEITEAGDETMSQLMGIKYDMDFRTLAEANNALVSPISSATKVHHIIGGYTDVFGNSYKEEIRKIFSVFSDVTNYPIYFHCWGGADRTGTIAFLVNGLCGVDEETLVRDYEMTSFSIFGVRADDFETYNFSGFLSQLKTYEGDTLSEKIENYLLSIGVTADEIHNIKAIMFGEDPQPGVSCPTQFDSTLSSSLELAISNRGEVSAITLNGDVVAFTEIEAGVQIAASDFPSGLVTETTVNGVVTFANGSSKTFSFLYICDDIPKLSEYWKTTTGSVVLAGSDTVSSTEAVGYGQKIRMDLQTVSCGSDGGLKVAIGSYGFELRGGEFRPQSLSASGTWSEVARYTDHKASNDFFDTEDSKLVMSVTMENDLPVLYIKAINSTGTKEYTYTFPSRIADEIASEDGVVSFAIRTDQITSLTIQTGKIESLPNLADYWTTASGQVILDSETTLASSDEVIGYGKTLQIDLKTVRAGDYGSLYIMIGSYGVRLRASTFRMAQMTDGGTPAEVQPRSEYSASTDGFMEDGAYLVLTTEVLSETEMLVSWKQVKGNGVVASEGSHTFTRISGEIASEDAKVTIQNDPSQFESVTIYVGR